MEIKQQIITAIEASTGMMLANADETQFGKAFYIANSDSIDNYHEVTEEYATEREKQIEAELQQ